MEEERVIVRAGTCKDCAEFCGRDPEHLRGSGNVVLGTGEDIESVLDDNVVEGKGIVREFIEEVSEVCHMYGREE
jgi:hypothetical protein